MNEKVFVKVSLLRKCLSAFRVLAFKRPFARVGPQMVKKIMPLSKRQIAGLQVAFHQAVPAVSARVLVLD